MSQQGERHTGTSGHGDDWWGQLYDAQADDAGPATAPDTLDDRFASAANTFGSTVTQHPTDAGPFDSPSPPNTIANAPANTTEPYGPAVPRPGPAPAEPAPWRGPFADTAPDEPPGGDGAAPELPDGYGPSGPRPTPSTADAGASGTYAPGATDAYGSSAPRRAAPVADADASAGATSATSAKSTDAYGPSGLQRGAPGTESPGAAAGAEGPDAYAPAGRRRGFSADDPEFADPYADPEPPDEDEDEDGPSGRLPGRPADEVELRDPYDPHVPYADHKPPDRHLHGGPRTLPDQKAPHAGQFGPPEPASAVPSRPPAPWEPRTASGPVTFPDGPKPAGARAQAEQQEPESAAPPAPRPRPPAEGASESRAASVGPVAYVGDRPPTYEAEPTVLPAADPDDLGDLVADTVLDGARYGACTLRAVSVRGDSARYRGEPRRDALLTARFGGGRDALVLVALATGARAAPGAHRAAAEACEWIGRAVGRSHVRLVEDIRAARRGDLKSGLHRLTDRSLGKLRAHAADLGLEPEEYTASLRCVLLPADPDCRTRVFFGVGAGGLFRLREGEWQDIEPRVADTAGAAVVGYGSLPPGTAGPAETPEGDRLTMDLGITTPPSPYEPSPKLSAALEQGGAPIAQPRDPFRFRASVARPGDTLLLCSSGLAEPLRGEPELAEHLTRRWADADPPGLAAFLADVQVRVKGYADDRTAAAVWEA